MKRWSDIKIDTSRYQEILNAVDLYKDSNPACNLISYWSERRGPEIEKMVLEKEVLMPGYVGSGWPEVKDQTWVLDNDTFHLRGSFPEHHFRDVGDAIYQANRMLAYNSRIESVMDFGSGYGRLAVPFLFWGVPKYYGVDYVPISLLIAPQFVEQATGRRILHSLDIYEILLSARPYDFISVPAWALNHFGEDDYFDVFISVHSFQEMTREAVQFYCDFATAHSKQGSLFYSINIMDYEYICEGEWDIISDVGYPINRDGHYNETIWRRK